MSDGSDDLVCPECGGPIGTTSTYCMHCSADLTGSTGSEAVQRFDRKQAITETPSWDGATDGEDGEASETPDEVATQRDLPPDLRSTRASLEPRILPDRFAIKATTFLLAIAGGLTAGVLTAIGLGSVSANGYSFAVAVFAWLGATAVLLRLVPG